MVRLDDPNIFVPDPDNRWSHGLKSLPDTLERLLSRLGVGAVRLNRCVEVASPQIDIDDSSCTRDVVARRRGHADFGESLAEYVEGDLLFVTEPVLPPRSGRLRLVERLDDAARYLLAVLVSSKQDRLKTKGNLARGRPITLFGDGRCRDAVRGIASHLDFGIDRGSKQGMSTRSAKQFLANVVHGEDMAPQLVTEPVERADERAHVVGGVLVPAGKDTGEGINYDQGDRSEPGTLNEVD